MLLAVEGVSFGCIRQSPTTFTRMGTFLPSTEICVTTQTHFLRKVHMIPSGLLAFRSPSIGDNTSPQVEKSGVNNGWGVWSAVIEM